MRHVVKKPITSSMIAMLAGASSFGVASYAIASPEDGETQTNLLYAPDDARAANDVCHDAAMSAPARAIISLLGRHASCERSFAFHRGEEGFGASIYPMETEVTLRWEDVIYQKRLFHPEGALEQGRWTITAEEPTPLSADWFAAQRDALFWRDYDWTAFDAATVNDDGVIDFELPEGDNYRGPIIRRSADGAILSIDVVVGNF